MHGHFDMTESTLDALTAAGTDHDALATKADLDPAIGSLRIELRIVGAFVLLVVGKQFGVFEAVVAVL